MAQKTVKIDEQQHEQLREIYEKEGVPIAEQVRRAIKDYLKRRENS